MGGLLLVCGEKGRYKSKKYYYEHSLRCSHIYAWIFQRNRYRRSQAIDMETFFKDRLVTNKTTNYIQHTILETVLYLTLIISKINLKILMNKTKSHPTFHYYNFPDYLLVLSGCNCLYDFTWISLHVSLPSLEANHETLSFTITHP